MRTSLALLTLAALTPLAGAGDLRFFDDAALHAVQFMDNGLEGWAAGDEGVVWHTIDGGKSWDRQPTGGVRASLRSLHFINPLIGFAAGREELPLGAGSAGVLLRTTNGGEDWETISTNAMPGLNCVRFLDAKTGFVLGDGSDQYPSGVFITRNTGRTWTPVPGPHSPGWLGGLFHDADNGALVGNWSRLANLRRGQVVPSVVDFLGGRNVRGVYQAGAEGRAVAVGQGGLILLSDDSGSHWDFLELRLSEEVRACWDLHAVHGAGKHVWAAGRPGSTLLHSGDGGKTWDLQKTGQSLPLNGLFFRDEKRGWAVGEFGIILHTTDGGRTWLKQQQGGKRPAVLFVHARSNGLPADTVTKLADEGYLTAALQVVCADSTSAPMRRAGDPAKLAAAMRLAGGAAAEQGWQMPLAAHLAREKREAILEKWDDIHGGKAGEQVLRQLVLALRMWRPDVVVCDPPDELNGALDGMIAEAVREAFKQAADPKVFPEQLAELGLREWKAYKVYAPAPESRPGAVLLNLSDVRQRLQTTARDFAAPAASLLAGEAIALPRRRSFQLVASHLAGADKHVTLMEGVPASATGDSRRAMPPIPAMTAEMQKAQRTLVSLQALVETPLSGLSQPERLLGAVGSMLAQVSDGQGAVAAHALASQMVRLGQWHLAREAFLQITERYPAHPLTADAYRWLIRHNSSSETRRRHELGQFLIYDLNLPTGPTSVKQDIHLPAADGRTKKGQNVDRSLRERTGTRGASAPPSATFKDTTFDGRQKQPDPVVTGEKHGTLVARDVSRPRDREQTLRWHRGSLELEPRLAAFGPLLADEPAMQFCLHAARRNVGDFETPRKWFSEFASRQPPGAWRDAALTELWLSSPRGAPPKPLLMCRQTETRPFLDGKFDDRCWKGMEPMVLRDTAAPGKGDALAKTYPTQVRLAYDNDFLYLALRCEHPAGRQLPPAKGRKRDEDLRAHDRVSLLLDLDRDYATAFHLQVDQRGCVRESCWGNVSWNPKWFVAAHSEEDAWQVEAAIPLAALTGDLITSGKAWACNVVRTIPGRGVQAWSLPAGVPEDDPRLEGMGILMFKVDPHQEAQRQPGQRMQRAPE